MQYSAEYFVEQLQMLPHPEGGWYKETYRSEGMIQQPAGFSGPRNYSTGIYFLLQQGQFSAFHRIKSDEMWHFYYGGPLNVYVIDNTGQLTIIKLGNNPANGEVFQAVVAAGCWFASQPAIESKYSLVGCTVAPGFNFADFEMANRGELLEIYPQHSIVIDRLTTG